MTLTSILADILLTARMGFVARDNKPARTARLTERATKFRKAAACSTWNDKTSSAEIRQAIVNLLPLVLQTLAPSADTFQNRSWTCCIM